MEGLGREGLLVEDGGGLFKVLLRVVVVLVNLLVRDLFSASRLVILLDRVLLEDSVEASLAVSWLSWD